MMEVHGTRKLKIITSPLISSETRTKHSTTHNDGTLGNDSDTLRRGDIHQVRLDDDTYGWP